MMLLGASAGPVATSAGLKLVADASWAGCDPATLDTLLVPGGVGVDVQKHDQPLLDWLRRAEPRVRRLGSVCSGALILAEAGLFDGRKATTHWADLAALGSYPAIEVQGDRLHTYDPTDPQAAHLFSSAGVTAGIDLALALVEADLGRALALAVAQRLVMFLRRPGGQTQFSPLLMAPTSSVARLAALLEWIPGHLGRRSFYRRTGRPGAHDAAHSLSPVQPGNRHRAGAIHRKGASGGRAQPAALRAGLHCDGGAVNRLRSSRKPQAQLSETPVSQPAGLLPALRLTPRPTSLTVHQHARHLAR
jgi:putative intracellular protease/amidase